MITTIYHVSVSGSHELREMLSIDNEISEAFGQEISRIRGNAVDSGCNMYDDHEEWAEFQSSPAGKRLTVDKIYEYTAGEAQKRLKIIRLKRK